MNKRTLRIDYKELVFDVNDEWVSKYIIYHFESKILCLRIELNNADVSFNNLISNRLILTFKNTINYQLNIEDISRIIGKCNYILTNDINKNNLNKQINFYWIPIELLKERKEISLF